jgi:hypothetical protein
MKKDCFICNICGKTLQIDFDKSRKKFFGYEMTEGKYVAMDDRENTKIHIMDIYMADGHLCWDCIKEVHKVYLTNRGESEIEGN